MLDNDRYVSRLVWWDDLLDNRREMYWEGTRGDFICFLRSLALSPLVRVNSVEIMAIDLGDPSIVGPEGMYQTLAHAIAAKGVHRARADSVRCDGSPCGRCYQRD